MPFSYPLIAFLGGLGGGEMVLIFIVALMLFGGKRLPELARGVGRSVREFKKATSGVETEIKRVFEEPLQPARPSAPRPSVIEPLPSTRPSSTELSDDVPPTPPPSAKPPA